MHIHHDQTGAKGRYRTAPEGGPGAEMTCSRASDRLVIIDHTSVPDACRGQGLGAALVAHAIEEARRGGWRILPLCPFAAAQFRRHPEWQDVLNG